jgi:hypothetical protein
VALIDRHWRYRGLQPFGRKATLQVHRLALSRETSSWITPTASIPTLMKAMVIPILMKEVAVIPTHTIMKPEVMATPMKSGLIQGLSSIGRDLSMLAATGKSEHSL